MSPRFLRHSVRAVLVSAFLLASASPSFAPHVAQLQINPEQANAGQEVTVFGPRGYGRSNPVEIRFGTVDGPVLGTFQPNEELYAMWGPGTVRLPDDLKPGVYDLFATQTLAPAETHIRGVPARGQITILGPGGPPVLSEAPAPAFDEQPAVRLLEDESVSNGTVLLVALGVAGAGLFVAGMAAAISSRRRQSNPSAQTVSGK